MGAQIGGIAAFLDCQLMPRSRAKALSKIASTAPVAPFKSISIESFDSKRELNLIFLLNSINGWSISIQGEKW